MTNDVDVVDAEVVARTCGWTLKTLWNRRSAGMQTPPSVQVPGMKRPVWLRRDLIEWLEMHRVRPARRGRPRKGVPS